MLLLIEAYGTKRLQMASAEAAVENETDFGKYKIQAVFEHLFLTKKSVVCLGLKADEDEFYFLADGCGIEVISTDETQFLKCDNLTMIHMKVFKYE